MKRKGFDSYTTPAQVHNTPSHGVGWTSPLCERVLYTCYDGVVNLSFKKKNQKKKKDL